MTALASLGVGLLGCGSTSSRSVDHDGGNVLKRDAVTVVTPDPRNNRADLRWAVEDAVCGAPDETCPAGLVSVHPMLADDPFCGERVRCVQRPEIAIVGDPSTQVSSPVTRERWPVDAAYRPVDHGPHGLVEIQVGDTRPELLALAPGRRYALRVERRALVEVVEKDQIPLPLRTDVSEHVPSLIAAGQRGRPRRVELTVASTLGFGCVVAPWVLEENVAVASASTLMLPVYLDGVPDATRVPVTGRFRIVGHYTGKRMALADWVAMSGARIRTEHACGEPNPVFAVEDWCYLPPDEPPIPAGAAPPRDRWCR